KKSSSVYWRLSKVSPPAAGQASRSEKPPSLSFSADAQRLSSRPSALLHRRESRSIHTRGGRAVRLHAQIASRQLPPVRREKARVRGRAHLYQTHGVRGQELVIHAQWNSSGSHARGAQQRFSA